MILVLTVKHAVSKSLSVHSLCLDCFIKAYCKLEIMHLLLCQHQKWNNNSSSTLSFTIKLSQFYHVPDPSHGRGCAGMRCWWQREANPTTFCSRHIFSTDRRESRHQIAAKFNSAGSQETWESSPSITIPLSSSPKGTLTDNERGNAGTAKTQGCFN